MVATPPSDPRYTIGPIQPAFTQIPRDSLWTSSRFLTLSLPAQGLFLLLLTSPLIDAAGIVRSTAEGLAERLQNGNSAATFSSSLDEVEGQSLINRCGDEIFCTGWFEISNVFDAPKTFSSFVTAEAKISHAATRESVHKWLAHGVRCKSDRTGITSSLIPELHAWGKAHCVDFGQIRRKKDKKVKEGMERP